jgi:hypothetical protein
MAQPVWNTPAGSIGSYPYGVVSAFQFSASAVLPATSIASYVVLAGSLPTGVTLNTTTGILSGIPILVLTDTISTFTVRATDNQGNIRDRTFTMTITGSAVPQFLTPAGVLLSTQDSIWTQINIQYSNPDPTNEVIVELQAGLLPPGLELSPTGLIQGYPEPPTVNVTLPLLNTVGFSTDSSTGYISALSVNGVTPGRPVTFTTPIGGLVAGTVYYVREVNTNLSAFTISATQNGSQLPVTTSTGGMSISFPPISTGQPTIRTFNFTLRLVSLLGNNTSSYAITVINQQTPASQGGPGKTPNSRFPTLLNTRPLTINISESDPYYGYYILPPVSPTSFAEIGTVMSDDYFAFKLLGYDFDGNPLAYSVSGLPSDLSYNDVTGWITGTPQLNSSGINSYSFNARVFKTGNESFSSNLFNFTFNVSKNVTGNIEWITPSDLGSIFNEVISTLKVNAISDVPLEYRVTSGSLPPNLVLLSNGEITGFVATQPTNELLDVGDSTDFIFTIQAFSPSLPSVQTSRTFKLTVLQEFGQPTDILYIKAAPSIQDRNIIESLLTSETLIPTASLYRPDDVYFGKSTSVIYQHAFGIYASDIDQYIASVTRNHYWRNITLGELKTAVAKNDAGEIIYEVVYSEVVDNLVNPQGVSVPSQIFWPRPIDLNLGPWYTSVTDIFTSYYFGQPGNAFTVSATTSGTNTITCNSTIGLLTGREVIFSGTSFGNIVAGTTYYVLSVESLTEFTISTTPFNGTAVVLTTDTGSMNCTIYEPTFYTSLTPGFARILYPNSLFNMRNRVASVLGQEYNSKLLPLWMTSQQENGNTLGYTQAWVICYTKPGFANTVKANIDNQWPHTLNQINFKIDRFTVDKSATYDYDNKLNPPAWTGLPSAQPVPDPLDSKDFYVLFPRQTILPDETQY